MDCFLDADDFWAPEKLQIQLDTINAKSGCLCYSGARFFYGDSTFCGKDISVPESVTFKELCHGNVIITSSVLIKKKYLLEFTMERSDLHEDYITWLKILNKYGKAIGINKPLTLHRLTKASKSGQKIKSALATWRTYLFIGLSIRESIICFMHYIIHGIKRYRDFGDIQMKKLISNLLRIRIWDISHIFKFIIAWPIARIYRHRRRHIWLICEYKDEARDNAYWFLNILQLNKNILMRYMQLIKG